MHPFGDAGGVNAESSLKYVVRIESEVLKCFAGRGRKGLVGREEAGGHGVEVHFSAGGAEVVAATFVDDEGFVASAEEVDEELMASAEAAGVSAQKPFHADD